MIIKYLAFFTAFTFGFLSLVLLLKKSPIKRANNVLAVPFIAITLCCVCLFLLYLGYKMPTHWILKFYIPLDVFFLSIMGPSIYLYVLEILGVKNILKTSSVWIHSLSALPSIIYVIYFASLPTSQRVAILSQNYIEMNWELQALSGIFFIQMTTYLAICYFKINNQIKKTNFIQFNTILVDITWLRTYFIIDLSIMVISIPCCIYFNNDYANSIIALIALIIQGIYIFIKTVWQSSINNERIINNNEQKLETTPTLLMTETLADIYIKQLTKIMLESKPYLKQNCTIQDISKLSSISVHHISNCLNTRLLKSFTDFINEFRIETAKQQLQNPNLNFTIESIAFDCGFGSKQNFNLSFKKITNLTPIAYRKAYIQQQNSQTTDIQTY